MSERELNQHVADRLCEDFAWDGRTFCQGDCVALLNGKIVAVKDNARDAILALRAIDRDPQRGMVVEVSHPQVDVIRRGR